MRDRFQGGRRQPITVAILLAISLVLTSCGGASSTDGEDNGNEGGTNEANRERVRVDQPESGLEEAGDPVRGGTLVYGIEADSTGGFCLSEAQLAISGMLVVRAIYDTLTVPNAEGGYSPYLAKDVTSNDDHTEWTIELREGIKFHDGSDLTAEVVKNNLDAYRGVPGDHHRSSALIQFLLRPISDVEVTGPLEVTVTTEIPWVSFPAYLFSGSRLGIMAQAQLDNEVDCGAKPIGTGPFVFESWTENVSLTANANPDYWQIAPDGEPYPYLDRIEFRPQPDSTMRNQALESGDFNMIHSSNGEHMVDRYLPLVEEGKANMIVSEIQAEVSFIQLNATEPPFNDPRMRKAMAMGADIAEINEQLNAGVPTVASGPYGPDSFGFVDGSMPEYDPEAAKALVEEYVAEGNDPSFTLSATNDPSVIRLAEEVQSRAQEIGVQVDISLTDQATLITAAIGRDYQAMTFRNYPGGDPDLLYIWFYGGPGEDLDNLVNFSGTNDDEVDRLLDEGRSESDPDTRAEIYQDLQRHMASEVMGIWAWYTPWAIVSAAEVHNVMGPPLPGDDPTAGEATTDDPTRQPNGGLANAHSLLGIWIES